MDLSSKIISTFAGDGFDDSNNDGHPAGQASLKSPVALAIDSDRWIYIADSSAHQIRFVTPAGTIHTGAGGKGRGFAGDGGPGILSLLDTPTGVAATGKGIYVADSFNYRIRRLF